jgi:hypothetical protein
VAGLREHVAMLVFVTLVLVGWTLFVTVRSTAGGGTGAVELAAMWALCAILGAIVTVRAVRRLRDRD